jgi:hypothetical protein
MCGPRRSRVYLTVLLRLANCRQPWRLPNLEGVQIQANGVSDGNAPRSIHPKASFSGNFWQTAPCVGAPVLHNSRRPISWDPIREGTRSNDTSPATVGGVTDDFARESRGLASPFDPLTRKPVVLNICTRQMAFGVPLNGNRKFGASPADNPMKLSGCRPILDLDAQVLRVSSCDVSAG